MHIDDLSTPSLLIEKKRLDANLLSMQARADAQGVGLRPHTKTHKSVVLARRQLDHGATGITVAKPSEAEVFVKAGFTDVRLAYEVIGDDKYARLLRLMDEARISFCVDTMAGAELANRFFAEHNTQAEVLIEVDTGYGRCGERWDGQDLIELAQFISDAPGLKLAGLLTHAGQSYKGGEDPETALRAASMLERNRMLEAALRVHHAGVPEAQPNVPHQEHPFEISVGSTPSTRYFENAEQDGFTITEMRPGNYIFNDAIQQGIGAAHLPECALTVLATVISKHRDPNGSERVFIDAGRKVFTGDTGSKTEGFGIILYNPRTMQPLPHARITGLSEEHGWISVPGGSTLDVGNRVRVIPNHACVVINNLDNFHVIDGHNVVETLAVDARGRVW